MNVRHALKMLVLAAVTTLGFAANANAVPVSIGNGPLGFHHHVPAVPEADTWAMMAVGLGLVGLRLRRKSKKSQDAVK
ncbi:MAG: PEP-CTERM sorting domain-containing protein [Sulfuriferula sp.]|nr:PEP-CTERM sorting domain-containing protein [Sulfuriferula sp.]